jgi:hypothetical protein
MLTAHCLAFTNKYEVLYINFATLGCVTIFKYS